VSRAAPVAIGTFDGVPSATAGHRGADTVVTFEPHPRPSSRAARRLLTTSTQAELMATSA
jgi:FAD synthase